MRCLLAALLAACALALPAQGAPPPAPAGSSELLEVPPLARVSDSAGALTPAQRDALSAKLQAFEQHQGAQIAIVLVPSTRGEPIEDYAHRVGEAWKIGRRGVGDGVLIIVAVQDRAARIDVARSLEGAIPDLVAARIIREQMAPHFARRDFAGGLDAALDVLFARIATEGLAPAQPGAGRGAPENLDRRLPGLLPYLIGGLILAALLRSLFGVLGALISGGVALGVVTLWSSSLVLGILAGLAVFVLTLVGVPVWLASQVLSGRGGFGGGGGFRSGGGGDFSGGGASGRW